MQCYRKLFSIKRICKIKNMDVLERLRETQVYGGSMLIEGTDLCSHILYNKDWFFIIPWRWFMVLLCRPSGVYLQSIITEYLSFRSLTSELDFRVTEKHLVWNYCIALCSTHLIILVPLRRVQMSEIES